MVASFPAMFPLFMTPYRRGLIKGFPYSAFYEVMEKGTEIEVVAIINQRRDPDYLRLLLLPRQFAIGASYTGNL
jgi:hypothetical protein